MTNFQLCFEITSLRSKCFRLVSQQKKARNGIFGFDHARNEMRTIFRMVFDSCSAFFTPKQHKNACYAGYEIISLSLRACLRKQPKFHSNLQLVSLRNHVWGMTDDLSQPRSGQCLWLVEANFSCGMTIDNQYTDLGSGTSSGWNVLQGLHSFVFGFWCFLVLQDRIWIIAQRT